MRLPQSQKHLNQLSSVRSQIRDGQGTEKSQENVYIFCVCVYGFFGYLLGTAVGPKRFFANTSPPKDAWRLRANHAADHEHDDPLHGSGGRGDYRSQNTHRDEHTHVARWRKNALRSFCLQNVNMPIGHLQ